ncbi:MAG: hypothetical protein REI09_06315, partial [Candidatus Dactylopiibacterium sp.]|nr:hypothetical protein [Candidatus Dactylopiibacterium sp.]
MAALLGVLGATAGVLAAVPGPHQPAAAALAVSAQGIALLVQNRQQIGDALAEFNPRLTALVRNANGIRWDDASAGHAFFKFFESSDHCCSAGQHDRARDDFLDGLKDDFKRAATTRSPLILDLDGDGVETTALAAGVYFDHDGNRFSELSGWVGGDDGLLARDRNADGSINGGNELFGDNTLLANGQKAANGFAALQELDANRDGVVDEAEAAAAGLQIWKDTNQNGRTDAGELLGFVQAGVRSVATGAAASSFVDAQGNSHSLVGSYRAADGSTRAATDVWFAVDSARTAEMDKVAVSATIAALPDIAGFGNVRSLHQAMARDGSGHLQALVERFVAEGGTVEREALVTQIIYAWAGVEGIDPASRAASTIYGNAIGDARKLASLEALLGESYVGVWCWGTPDPNPHAPAANILLQAFDKLVGYVKSQLDAPAVDALVGQIGLVWNKTKGAFELDFEPVVNALESQYAENPQLAQSRLGAFYSRICILRGGAGFAEQLRSFGSLEGHALDQHLATLGYANVQLGGDGDDSLVGLNGKDDFLVGGRGNDTITDQGGNDRIEGGA